MAHGGRARGGEGGGHQRAVWEQQKVHWFPLFSSLKNLTTGLRVGGWGRRGEVAHGGRARGGDGRGYQRAVWEQLHWFCFWTPLQLVEEGGGWGEAWGGEGGQGGRWAGAIREQCGSNKRCTGFPVLGSLKNLTTGLIWLVTRVGAWGEAWGGGPWRAGKGGDGGGHWFPLLGSLKNLSTGLIWLVTRVGGWGEAWGGGPWRAGKGGDGGGHRKAVQKVFPFLAPLKT